MPRISLRKNPFSAFSTAFGIAFGTAAADGLRPFAQEELNNVWPLHAVKPLTPELAAQAEVIAGWTPKQVRDEAAKTGYGPRSADALRAMAGQAPGVALLLQLRNRGRIKDADVLAGLAQLGIRQEWRADVLALRTQLPSAQELATMAVQGVIDVDDAKPLAALVGTDAATFDRYYRVAGEPPGGAELLTLWNRGAISEDDVERGLRQSRLKPEWVDKYKALRRYIIPASDVIRLAVHEVYDAAKRKALDLDAEYPEAFTAKARLLGISEPDARDLWAGHWQLPSYSQAAQMLFRGEISRDQFETLLAAQDYAPTWRGKLEAIARAIPTVSDFQRLVRRGIYGGDERKRFGYDAEYPEAFTAKMALHGFNEQDARDLWAGGWRMPSATQLDHMLWRGEIDEADLNAGLKALDYPVFWRDKLAAIARPTLGRIDIRRAYANGLISRTKALELYGKLGYTPEDSAIQLRLATVTGGTSGKDLTAAQLASEYERGMIDADEYGAELTALGFDADEVAQLRALAERKRVDRAREQAISTIRTAYIGHRLGESEARAALAARGVPAAAVDAVFNEWEAAHDANVRVLTPAQLAKLYKAAQLTKADAVAELMFRGYSQRNAERLTDTWD